MFKFHISGTLIWSDGGERSLMETTLKISPHYQGFYSETTKTCDDYSNHPWLCVKTLNINKFLPGSGYLDVLWEKRCEKVRAESNLSAAQVMFLNRCKITTKTKNSVQETRTKLFYEDKSTVKVLGPSSRKTVFKQQLKSTFPFRLYLEINSYIKKREPVCCYLYK